MERALAGRVAAARRVTRAPMAHGRGRPQGPLRTDSGGSRRGRARRRAPAPWSARRERPRRPWQGRRRRERRRRREHQGPGRQTAPGWTQLTALRALPLSGWQRGRARCTLSACACGRHWRRWSMRMQRCARRCMRSTRAVQCFRCIKCLIQGASALTAESRHHQYPQMRDGSFARIKCYHSEGACGKTGQPPLVRKLPALRLAGLDQGSTGSTNHLDGPVNETRACAHALSCHRHVDEEGALAYQRAAG